MKSRAHGFGIEQLPRIVRGSGSCLYDADGRRYLDGSGGPAVFSLGHAHPEVNAAIARQLGDVAHGYRYLFSSSPLEELTAHLLRSCGGTFQDIIYASSGSEAVESALKIALQYFSARGLMKKRRFISRRRSWHGDTLGALSISGFAERRNVFEGSLLDVTFVSAANRYRLPEGVTEQTLVWHLAAELDHTIQTVGPDSVAAFIFEPIVGAAGGVVPAPPGYAQAVQAVCRKHDVVLIADEVMCGVGRTGTWRALEYDGVEPDIMCVAKGLAGGYVPLSATLITQRVASGVHKRHAAYLTGHTFTGHTTACAAGLAVQRIIERDDLLTRVQTAGAALQTALRQSLERFSEVGDVRGRGYFIGIEFVSDRRSKQPFPRQRGLSVDIGARAFDNGLICYPCAGNVNGVDGDSIILSPPYNASDAELEEIVEKLGTAVGAALTNHRSSN